MDNQDASVTCDEVRELAKDFPEEAAVIIEMLKAAGEDCDEEQSVEH